MNLKLLPLDVIRLICSFGYPKHKQYMNEICSYMRMKTEILDLNLSILKEEYHKFYANDGMECFLTCEADEEVLKDLFKQCTKCCCCSKHCHNRPTNYYTDEQSVGENINENCPCSCRSISRYINRVNKSENKQNWTRQTRFNKLFVSLASLK